MLQRRHEHRLQDARPAGDRQPGERPGAVRPQPGLQDQTRRPLADHAQRRLQEHERPLVPLGHRRQGGSHDEGPRLGVRHGSQPGLLLFRDSPQLRGKLHDLPFQHRTRSALRDGLQPVGRKGRGAALRLYQLYRGGALHVRLLRERRRHPDSFHGRQSPLAGVLVVRKVIRHRQRDVPRRRSGELRLVQRRNPAARNDAEARVPQ